MSGKFWEHLKDGLPQNSAARLTVYTLHSCVPDEVPQLVIDDNYAFRRIFDNQFEEQPFATQPLHHVVALGDVPSRGHDVVIAVELLGHAYKHNIDRAGHARHGSPRSIALIFAGTNAGSHQAHRQLSLLWAENFFNSAANDLVVIQTIGTLGCTIEIRVHEAAIAGGTEQRQPIRRIVKNRLNLGPAGPKLTVAMIGNLLQPFV